eukprot:Awhi_evm1s6580
MLSEGQLVTHDASQEEKDRLELQLFEKTRDGFINKFNNIALVLTLFLTVSAPIVTTTLTGRITKEDNGEETRYFLDTPGVHFWPFATYFFGMISLSLGSVGVLWTLRVVGAVHSNVYNMTSFLTFLTNDKFIWFPEVLQFWSIITCIISVGCASVQMIYSIEGTSRQLWIGHVVTSGTFVFLAIGWIALSVLDSRSRKRFIIHLSNITNRNSNMQRQSM